MAIISKKFNKKINRSKKFKSWLEKIKNWWFCLTKLKFMRKRIKKIIKSECVRLNIEAVSIQEIFIVPSDFKKLSNQQIETGLNLFVKRKELDRWEQKNKENTDRYLLIFPAQNRSESRILNRIPEEINLNDIQLERLPQLEQEKLEEQHLEQTTLTDDEVYDAINKARHLEVIKELPAEKMLDAKIPVHAEQSDEPTKQQEVTPKRKSVWDD